MAFDFNKHLKGKYHKRSEGIYQIKEVSTDGTFGILRVSMVPIIKRQYNNYYGNYVIVPFQMPMHNNEEAFCRALSFTCKNINIFRLLNGN